MFSRRSLLAAASSALGLAAWTPAVHLLFPTDSDDLRAFGRPSARARALAERHLHLWESEDARTVELRTLRAGNAEWDFMGRTFLVLALANIALRESHQQERLLAIIDRIVDDTLEVEAREGMYWFLMPYARSGRWRGRPTRSIFLDGEIALMLAVRQFLEPRAALVEPLAERIERIRHAIEEGPAASGESYPDECWSFCNTVALAALTADRAATGRDSRAHRDRRLRFARRQLVDEDTGLLVSSYTWDGRALDGPEGSSIWMAAHCLRLAAPEWAAFQYSTARTNLAADVFGFGYAREWPANWRGPADVDSGPIVPLLGASAGASGLALLGAASFGDRDYLSRLLRSVDVAAFPVAEGRGEERQLRYAASNQVGDAVMLYALVQGPLWDSLQEYV